MPASMRDGLAAIDLGTEQTALGRIPVMAWRIVPSPAILMAAYFLVRLGWTIAMLGICTSDPKKKSES
jgi:hypothetical protein